ncbi:MAG TPA: BTAD domain-containing putative transcriptional regulator [Gemmatimonadaceae bacterium]|nr:BTAD domain-containing putative transcriptional regulator [Gemmatimonadaceae bacterium]
MSIDLDGVPLAGRSTQRRRLALLALLAAAEERGLTRDKLLAYLWPERDTDRARHALSQTLYAVRQDLGDEALIGGIDEIRLNAQIVESDVAQFRAALAAGELERAVALYAGPFLDGFFVPDAPGFERWADEERGRAAAEYSAALEKLARAAEQQGEHARSAEWWRRGAALDPLNSQVALSLMRTLAASGDRAGALRHARIHTTMVRQELGASPDPAVDELSGRLQAQGVSVRADVAQPRADVAVPAPPNNPPAAVPIEVGAAGPWHRGSRRVAAMGIGLALLVVSGTFVVSRWQSASADPPRRTIVLSELRGTDTILALAVQEALRAELASAPDVRLAGESSIRETLRLMSIPEGVALTRPMARDVAQRQGAAFVIAGSVSPLGNGAQLVAELIDARTGAPIASVAERPATAGEVVSAVTRLARAIRGKVAGAPVPDPVAPLPAVTTASLPALRSYALARYALAAYQREQALIHGEAALMHDSLFALAHYLVGDLLWFLDEQRHGEDHLRSAYLLSDRLPPRERLLVRARYTHIVLDRPDSSLTYWRLLRAAYPDETLAYEGLSWAFRALAQPESAAVAAEAALRIDETAIVPNLRNRVISLIELGDTAMALALARAGGHRTTGMLREARFLATALYGAGAGAALAEQSGDSLPSYFRQTALLAMGSFADASRLMEDAVTLRRAQEPPRVLIAQARAELGAGLPSEHARSLSSRALEWLERADLSAPAYARLAERIAEAAARIGDTAMIARARRLLVANDAGRDLPSYRHSLMAVDAAAAFARGDMPRAASLAERAREWPIFARSIFTLVLLEADARRAMGDHARADSLYRGLLTPVPFGDGDIQTLISMRFLAERGLGRR